MSRYLRTTTVEAPSATRRNLRDANNQIADPAPLNLDKEQPAIDQHIISAIEQLKLFLVLLKPAGHLSVGAAVEQHQTDAPFALRLDAESAWIKTNMLASYLRATLERPITEIK